MKKLAPPFLAIFTLAFGAPQQLAADQPSVTVSCAYGSAPPVPAYTGAPSAAMGAAIASCIQDGGTVLIGFEGGE